MFRYVNNSAAIVEQNLAGVYKSRMLVIMTKI